MEENQVDMWAVVELMGHGRTAGVIRTSDLGARNVCGLPENSRIPYNTVWSGRGTAAGDGRAGSAAPLKLGR